MKNPFFKENNYFYEFTLIIEVIHANYGRFEKKSDNYREMIKLF